MAGQGEDQTWMSTAIATAKSSLEEAQKKIAEYDAQSKVPETASAFLKTAVQKAHDTLNDLGATADVLKEKSAEVSTEVRETLLAKMNAASAALEQVTTLAAKYAEEHQLSSTVVGAAEGPLRQSATALAEAAADARARATSQVGAITSSGLNFLLSSAVALDDSLGIENKAINGAGSVALAGSAALARAKTLLEEAHGLDSKVTGGKLTPVVSSLLDKADKGYSTAATGLANLHDEYQSAKRQHAEGSGKSIELEAR